MREGLLGALTALAIGLGCGGFALQADAADGIAVQGAWARATPAGAPAGAAFFIVENTAAEGDVLTAVSAPATSDVAELHTHAMDGGVMKMRKVEGIAVPAHGAVELKPGGLHVMLIGLKAPLAEGATFPLTLTFAKAGAVEVAVTVRGLGARAAEPAHGDMHGMHGGAGNK